MLSRSMLAVSLKRYKIPYIIPLICMCIYASTLPLLQVMWNAAVHAEYLHDHSDYGFEVGNVRFSWE